jgi:hypothetical protein
MRTFCFIVISLLCTSAFGDIVQDIGKGSGVLYGGGQTFTATANEPQVTTVSYMTGLADTSALKYPDPTITVNLRSGIGFEGPILGTKTVGPVSINTPPYTWIDFTFATPIKLVEGEQYTIEFAEVTPFFHSGTISFPSFDVYRDGNVYLGGDVYPGGSIITPEGPNVLGVDLNFRVLSVPEPCTATIIGIAACCCSSIRRRGNSCRWR